MFKDFRGYLDYLEGKGKLVRVKKEVSTKYEIAAGIRKASDTDGPALLFENVKGHPDWRVAGGDCSPHRISLPLLLEQRMTRRSWSNVIWNLTKNVLSQSWLTPDQSKR